MVKNSPANVGDWDDPGGWDGEGRGRGALDGEHICV